MLPAKPLCYYLGIIYGSLGIALVCSLAYWRQFGERRYLYGSAALLAMLLMAIGTNVYAAEYPARILSRSQSILILAAVLVGAHASALFIFFGLLYPLPPTRRGPLLSPPSKGQREALQDRKLDHTELMSLISHEVKTPLAVIDTAIQALCYRHTNLDESITRQYRRIRQAVAQTNRMVDMGIARLRDDYSPWTPCLVSIPVWHMLADCTDALADCEDRLNVVCRDGSQCRCNPCPPFAGIGCRCLIKIACTCDPWLIRVALSNLLSNAAKYADPGTPITLFTERDPNGVTFTVENACSELPAEVPTAMFEEHWRGANSTDTEGLGLGLYIVQAIARTHGGKASCRTTHGQISVSLFIPGGEFS